MQAVRIQELLKAQPICTCETLCFLPDRAILMRAEMSRGAYNEAAADYAPLFVSGPQQSSASVLRCDPRKPNEIISFIRTCQSN